MPTKRFCTQFGPSIDQIAEDFKPYWSFGAELRLERRSGKRPSTQNLSDMRGDAVLYLWNKVNVQDALGYHDSNFAGIPFGFVFFAGSNTSHAVMPH